MWHNQFINDRHTLIQRLFIKTQINELKGRKLGHYEPPEENDQLVSKIEEEADKVLQLHGSDSADYKKYLAMKAYTYLERGYKRCARIPIFDIDFLEKALEVIEPIKQQKEGVRIYTVVLTHIGSYYMSVMQYTEAIKYLKKAKQETELFKTKLSDIDTAMGDLELFDVCNMEIMKHCTRPSFSQDHHGTMISLYECYEALNDDEMKLKYVIPSIKGKIARAPLFETGYKIKFDHFIPSISLGIQFLITSRYFAQVDHLLAGLMYHLVKNRRELPAEDLPGVKHAQAIISHLFASWASVIIGYSIVSLKKKTYAENYPISDKIHHIAELIVDGAKIYEHQFPCKPILVRKEFEKYLKRAVLWCQRAIDLFVESNQVAAKAKELMTKLDHLKSTIDDLKELK